MFCYSSFDSSSVFLKCTVSGLGHNFMYNFALHQWNAELTSVPCL